MIQIKTKRRMANLHRTHIQHNHALLFSVPLMLEPSQPLEQFSIVSISIEVLLVQEYCCHTENSGLEMLCKWPLMVCLNASLQKHAIGLCNVIRTAPKSL